MGETAYQRPRYPPKHGRDAGGGKRKVVVGSGEHPGVDEGGAEREEGGLIVYLTPQA